MILMYPGSLELVYFSEMIWFISLTFLARSVIDTFKNWIDLTISGNEELHYLEMNFKIGLLIELTQILQMGKLLENSHQYWLILFYVHYLELVNSDH